jgi:hypothetical protein
VPITKTKSKALESTIGWMDGVMKAIGKTVKETARGNWFMQMEWKNMVFGLRINDSQQLTQILQLSQNKLT